MYIIFFKKDYIFFSQSIWKNCGLAIFNPTFDFQNG